MERRRGEENLCVYDLMNISGGITNLAVRGDVNLKLKDLNIHAFVAINHCHQSLPFAFSKTPLGYNYIRHFELVIIQKYFRIKYFETCINIENRNRWIYCLRFLRPYIELFSIL